MPAAIGLRHPASASCLGRHARLAGRCPNNSSLFPPLAAVVVVALWASRVERIFCIAVPKRLRAFRNCFFTGEIAVESLSGAHSFATLFLRPKRVRKGFFGVFQGDSMHFRGHSRRIAPFLPPFVVYYRHRAVLCSICHSRNSYRAENRPVTANRAVFCFLRVRVVYGSFQRICGAIRAQNRPKRAKRGTLGTTKAPGLEGA